MSDLTKIERQALAMHELMIREQQRYQNRINEQRKISMMTDDSLRKLVYGDKSALSNTEEKE